MGTNWKGPELSKWGFTRAAPDWWRSAIYPTELEHSWSKKKRSLRVMDHPYCQMVMSWPSVFVEGLTWEAQLLEQPEVGVHSEKHLAGRWKNGRNLVSKIPAHRAISPLGKLLGKRKMGPKLCLKRSCMPARETSGMNGLTGMSLEAGEVAAAWSRSSSNINKLGIFEEQIRGRRGWTQMNQREK